MYLRHATRRKDGKTHVYWQLVRSVRRGRKVVQETVAQLGELDGQGRARAAALARSISLRLRWSARSEWDDWAGVSEGSTSSALSLRHHREPGRLHDLAARELELKFVDRLSDACRCGVQPRGSVSELVSQCAAWPKFKSKQ